MTYDKVPDAQFILGTDTSIIKLRLVNKEQQDTFINYCNNKLDFFIKRYVPYKENELTEIIVNT